MQYEKLKFTSENFPLYFRDVSLRNDQHKQYTHFHTATELVYIHSGTLRIHIDSSAHLVHPNEMAAIPANIPHLFEAVSSTCDYTVLIFDSATLLPQFSDQRAFATFTDDSATVAQLNQLLQLRSKRTPFYREQTRALLMSVMKRLSEINSFPLSPRNIKCTPELETILLHICKYYREDLNIPEIAKMVGYHPDYLCRFFKKNMKITLSQYWNIVRCDLARRILMDGKSVTFAARRSGFTSLNYFSRIYKRIYGISPSTTLPDCPVLRKQNHRTDT